MSSLGRHITAMLFAAGLAFSVVPAASAKGDGDVRPQHARAQDVQYYYAPGYYGRPYWRHRHWRGYGGPGYWGRPRHYGPPPGYYRRHGYGYRY